MYRILYHLMKFMNYSFYRKTYVNGLEHFEPGRTYLLASNHPNGFFEPLIMACVFPIDLNFMVRGDLFDNPFLNWFLRSTHQIPIFRFVDGFSRMKENKSTLAEVTDKLAHGHSIIFYAEGSTMAVMKVRPIQKGIAKIAFQTFEEYPDAELDVLPIGINFSDWRSPGNEVILNVGKPFSANAFYNSDNTSRQILKMTRRIEEEMKKLVIDLEERDHELVIRKYWQLTSIRRSHWLRKTTDPALFTRMKNLEFRLNSGDVAVIKEIDDLFDAADRLTRHKPIMGSKKWWKVPLFLPGIPGYLFHFIPIRIGKWLKDNKVKRDAFAAPVLGVSAFILSIVLHTIFLIIGSIVMGFGVTLLLNFAFLFSGYLFLQYWENQRMIPVQKLPGDFFTRLDALDQKLNKR